MFSTLLALCEGNPLPASGSPQEGPAMQNSYFLCFQSEQTIEQTAEMPVVKDAMMLMWSHCNENIYMCIMQAKTNIIILLCLEMWTIVDRVTVFC